MTKKKAGRPKGVPNKVSADVKENIVAVFTRLGGTAAMKQWAERNPDAFYPQYMRLAPKEVDVTSNGQSLVVERTTFKP